MLLVNELFAGIGAFRNALIKSNIPHQIVGISEIDKFAIKSYEAIYGQTRNYGDISKVKKLDCADLWTYGFPCQDVSIAGKQAGITKGETRSGLLYEVQRLLVTAKEEKELPKFLIMENVKNLVGRKFILDFNGWLEWLDNIGYNNYWQVLDAKDYGIPQHRERVFVVSIRKDINTTFTFPEPPPLTVSLSNLLEDEVDEKYYLTDDTIDKYRICTENNAQNGKGFTFAPLDKSAKVAKTVTTKAGSRMTDNYISVPSRCHERGNTETKILAKREDGERIRKLTPLECWRLFGFDDSDFHKAEQVCSNTQLYKQAGNSIVVNVLTRILKNLPIESQKGGGKWR